MKQTTCKIAGRKLPCVSLNTLVVGSGAASLNAAVNLFDLGQEDVAIATDCWGGGTSNNTGSDKQTYYKLSFSGNSPDSVPEMAADLFSGGCMHGDIALCEAQNSARAFFHLVALGVPFPFDRFGGYVGYKTDHDPRQRGTSAGPLTSQLMFRSLARAVQARGIRVLDRTEVVRILTRSHENHREIIGVLALETSDNRAEPQWKVFNVRNLILGTGGPAGMYATSVYPESQLGSTGMAFAAGAVGHNLTESQFGLASTGFRWNLSGTYQQVIPRYISMDQHGKQKKEFLNQYFPDMGTLASAIFLKGYQWPFDPRKIRAYGSSLIDVLVFHETVHLKRRVFLDFTRNPSGAGVLDDFSLSKLNPEAHSYLKRSGALFGTPIERLQKMNQPAVDLYRNNGIDITREPLEIAVCAQHNNGGLKGDIWWESNLRHLFPVGEVNGTHGVYRPGGSALNSGQVGSLRAAQFIATQYAAPPQDEKAFIREARTQIEATLDFAESMLDPELKNDSGLKRTRQQIQERMTAVGSHIRDPLALGQAATQAWDQYERMLSQIRISSSQKWNEAFKNLDLCLTHALYLYAMTAYVEKGGKSRGSYLVLDPVGEKPCEAMDDSWRFSLNPEGALVDKHICEIFLDPSGKPHHQWVPVRPIPQVSAWFENVWDAFSKGDIFREEL